MKGSTAETARKRPERPWTAARTMEVLRRCPLAIAQRLVHCAIALSTAVLDRVTKTMSVAPLLTTAAGKEADKGAQLPQRPEVDPYKLGVERNIIALCVSPAARRVSEEFHHSHFRFQKFSKFDLANFRFPAQCFFSQSCSN